MYYDDNNTSSKIKYCNNQVEFKAPVKRELGKYGNN